MGTAKGELRRTMRRLRAGISVADQRRSARAASEYLARVAGASDIRAAALYAAVGTELSTARAFEALLARGIAVAYPRIVPGEHRLTFHRVQHPDELRPASFRIPEPDPDLPQVPVEQVDLFLVPGLAFDRFGARLGWGQGYYDRTLARNRRALRVGFAFEGQIVDGVPEAERDVPMDRIITEAGIRNCRDESPEPRPEA